MFRRRLCLCFALACAFYAANISAQTGPAAADTSAATPHDGQHDFDFEHGTWKIHLKKLLHPLTGSNQWVEFDGTSVTNKVWGGRANLEQFETDGAIGHIEGMTLRLYNPTTRQWSIYWANAKDGALGQPMVGEFKNGQGEFYDQEAFNGRMIYVRYIWSAITPNTAHFEQAFSDDGGKTWEVNWVTDQTRVSEAAQTWSDGGAPRATSQEPQPRAFDFEFGRWDAQLKRLVQPLSGSNRWVEYEGTSTVHKIWDGRANLGELDVSGAAGHIQGLTLRLYSPQSHQWSLYWANAKDATLNPPAIGQFNDGRGEFYDQEPFDGKAILVRFIFSDVSANSFHTEQSFSADGGKTWESNWMATFTKQKP
jgi:hypothetical protein